MRPTTTGRSHHMRGLQATDRLAGLVCRGPVAIASPLRNMCGDLGNIDLPSDSPDGRHVIHRVLGSGRGPYRNVLEIDAVRLQRQRSDAADPLAGHPSPLCPVARWAMDRLGERAMRLQGREPLLQNPSPLMARDCSCSAEGSDVRQMTDNPPTEDILPWLPPTRTDEGEAASLRAQPSHPAAPKVTDCRAPGTPTL